MESVAQSWGENKVLVSDSFTIKVHISWSIENYLWIHRLKCWKSDIYLFNRFYLSFWRTPKSIAPNVDCPRSRICCAEQILHSRFYLSFWRTPKSIAPNVDCPRSRICCAEQILHRANWRLTGLCDSLVPEGIRTTWLASPIPMLSSSISE